MSGYIEWKIIDWIPSFENIYEVNNIGMVRRINGKVLKYFYSRKYHAVTLCKFGIEKSVLVHRLVATAFVPNPENKPEVNHIDGNPENNFFKNLEWVTKQENMQHAKLNGLILPGKKGGDHPRSRKVAMYDLNGNLLKIFPSVIDVARFFGSKYSSHVVAVCNNRRFTAFCHIFRYIDNDEAVETKISVKELPHQSLDQINRKEYDTFRSAGLIYSKT